MIDFPIEFYDHLIKDRGTWSCKFKIITFEFEVYGECFWMMGVQAKLVDIKKLVGVIPVDITILDLKNEIGNKFTSFVNQYIGDEI